MNAANTVSGTKEVLRNVSPLLPSPRRPCFLKVSTLIWVEERNKTQGKKINGNTYFSVTWKQEMK